MKKVGVAILGLGVVGGGVYKILTGNKEYFKKSQGLDITVENVLEKNPDRAKELGVPESAVLLHGKSRLLQCNGSAGIDLCHRPGTAGGVLLPGICPRGFSACVAAVSVLQQ